MGNKRTSWYVTISIVILSLVLAYIGYQLPAGATATRPMADHWRMAIAVMVATLWLGAAIEFLISVKVFKSGLRLAYRLFATAMILVGITYLQFPIAGLLSAWGSWWINGGAAMVPFIAGGAMMYAGLRRFGLLLHLGGFVLSFRRVAATTTLAAVLLYALAYLFAIPDIEGTEAYIAVVSWIGAFVCFTLLTTRRIVASIGQEYKYAMRHLELALFVLFLACIGEVSSSFFVSYGDFYIDYGVFMLPFAVAGLLLLLAARAFSQVGVYTIAASPAHSGKKALKDSDYLDSITTIASLASQPQDIDPVLDEMRKITAALKPEMGLTAEDKKRLLNVYKRVEEYLVSNDPLRSYSRQELRDRSQPAFRAMLTDS